MAQAQTKTEQAHLRVTDAALRQAVGGLIDAVLTQPTRGELEVLRHVCQRTLEARAERQERAA